MSMSEGEKLKVMLNLDVEWAVDFGGYGQALALSENGDFLLASSLFTSITYLGKLNSSDGSVIASSYV